MIDFQECEKYRHTNGNVTQEDITQWEVLDGYGVLYVTCVSSWTASIPYTIQAYPVDTAEGEMQAYPLITSGTGGKMAIIKHSQERRKGTPGQVEALGEVLIRVVLNL